MFLRINSLGSRILVLLLCYGIIVGAQLLLIFSIRSFINPIVYNELTFNTILLGSIFLGANILFFVLNQIFFETIIALTMLSMLVKMGAALAMIYPIIEGNFVYREVIAIFVVALYLIHLIIEFFVRKKILTIT